jgi:hypothetical protein
VTTTPKRKAVRFCKNRTAIKKYNIHNNMNATDFIAAVAFQKSAGAVFSAKPCAGINRQQYRAAKGCAKVLSTPAMGPVRKNIIIEVAVNLSDNEVFSRPEFGSAGFSHLCGFGRDGLVRKAGRMATSMFLTSRPPDARKNADGGFQSQVGAEAMTTVKTITTPIPGNPCPLTRQQAIENALSDALHLVRTSGTRHGIQAATGRAVRAAGLLKQACADFTTKGA